MSVTTTFIWSNETCINHVNTRPIVSVSYTFLAWSFMTTSIPSKRPSVPSKTRAIDASVVAMVQLVLYSYLFVGIKSCLSSKLKLMGMFVQYEMNYCLVRSFFFSSTATDRHIWPFSSCLSRAVQLHFALTPTVNVSRACLSYNERQRFITDWAETCRI